MLLKNCCVHPLRLFFLWSSSLLIVVFSDSLFPHEHWMKNLPSDLHQVPLNFLAIPGSHDSGTIAVRVNSSISPDAHPIYVAAASHLGRWLKFIISKWARTQSTSISQQLKMGIRYLDVRIAPFTTDRSQFYIVHEMFSIPLRSLVNDVLYFLHEHPREVLLLDFNHFYDMTEEEHSDLMNYLNDVLGTYLFHQPQEGRGVPSLNELWSTDKRIILFYHVSDILHFPFWEGNRCPSLWPNKHHVTDMLSVINKELPSLRTSADEFSVVQGVLTPRPQNIVFHALQGLEYMSQPATKAFIQWLRGKSTVDHQLNNVNICIVDFVEQYNFIDEVIQINLRKTVAIY